MESLEKLKERFSIAKKRQEELEVVVAESREQAQRRRELELEIEAEEIAVQVDAKQERFRQILRELPVLSLNLDQAMLGIMDCWNSIADAHDRREKRLDRLMFDHGYSLSFDRNGRPKPGCSSHEKFPDWIPVRSRITYNEKGDTIGFEHLTRDYYGYSFGNALRAAWGKAESRIGAEE